MKKLNKNKAWDYKDLNESQLAQFRKKVKLSCHIDKIEDDNKVYYDEKYKAWLNVCGDDGKDITEFTNAKELFD